MAYAVNHTEADWTKKFLGKTEEEEACPDCHNSLLIAKPGRDYIECAICGRKRKISLIDGKIRYDWPEDEGDRLTVWGKFRHMREIDYHAVQFAKSGYDFSEELNRLMALDYAVKPSRSQAN